MAEQENKRKQSLLILGAGGLGQDVAEIAQLSGLYNTIAFLDDDEDFSSLTRKSRFFPVLGRLDEAEKLVCSFTHAIPAFGNNALRLALISRLEETGYEIPALIHPTAYVSPRASLEKGCIVRAQAYIGQDVSLGKGCLVNVGCLIDHECAIGEGVHLGMGTIIRNAAHIQSMAFVPHGSICESSL